MRVSAPPSLGTLRALGTRARKANPKHPSTHSGPESKPRACLLAVSRKRNGGSIEDVAAVSTQGVAGRAVPCRAGNTEELERETKEGVAGKSHGKGRVIEQERARTPHPPHPIRLLSSNPLCATSDALSSLLTIGHSTPSLLASLSESPLPGLFS